MVAKIKTSYCGREPKETYCKNNGKIQALGKGNECS
jgi:hypothetical protein